MVLLKQTVAVVAALVMALAWVGGALHGHDADVQGADHADCDVCHFRHLPGVENDGLPAPSAADLVAQAVVSARPDGERCVALGTRPTRGPPA